MNDPFIFLCLLFYNHIIPSGFFNSDPLTIPASTLLPIYPSTLSLFSLRASPAQPASILLPIYPFTHFIPVIPFPITILFKLKRVQVRVF